MKRIDNDPLWVAACLDTPAQCGHATKEVARRSPGSHLKSYEREENGWSKFFGRLVHYEADPLKLTIAGLPDTYQVLVRSLGSPVSPAGTVWVGTIAEYLAMWDVD